jgi:hypothetical protein
VFVSIAKNHAFVDGNKRTAVVMLIILSEENSLVLPNDDGLFNIVLSVVNNKHDIPQISNMLFKGNKMNKADLIKEILSIVKTLELGETQADLEPKSESELNSMLKELQSRLHSYNKESVEGVDLNEEIIKSALEVSSAAEAIDTYGIDVVKLKEYLSVLDNGGMLDGGEPNTVITSSELSIDGETHMFEDESERNSYVLLNMAENGNEVFEQLNESTQGSQEDWLNSFSDKEVNIEHQEDGTMIAKDQEGNVVGTYANNAGVNTQTEAVGDLIINPMNIGTAGHDQFGYEIGKYYVVDAETTDGVAGPFDTEEEALDELDYTDNREKYSVMLVESAVSELTDGMEKGWYVMSGYDMSILSGPYDNEVEAQEVIDNDPEQAGGVTYLQEGATKLTEASITYQNMDDILNRLSSSAVTEEQINALADFASWFRISSMKDNKTDFSWEDVFAAAAASGLDESTARYVQELFNQVVEEDKQKAQASNPDIRQDVQNGQMAQELQSINFESTNNSAIKVGQVYEFDGEDGKHYLLEITGMIYSLLSKKTRLKIRATEDGVTDVSNDFDGISTEDFVALVMKLPSAKLLEGHYDIGNLPKSQSAVMDAYNHALAAGAVDKGENYVEFYDVENFNNTVATLGLDITQSSSGGSPILDLAMNKKEQLGTWGRKDNKGYINFARIFAILDKAGIVEGKRKMNKKLVKEEFEDKLVVELALWALQNQRDNLAMDLDLEDSVLDMLETKLAAEHEGITETYVKDLGVDVDPSKYYVVADSGAFHGGATTNFETEEEAAEWASKQPNINLADTDKVIKGEFLISAYSD